MLDENMYLTNTYVVILNSNYHKSGFKQYAGIAENIRGYNDIGFRDHIFKFVIIPYSNRFETKNIHYLIPIETCVFSPSFSINTNNVQLKPLVLKPVLTKQQYIEKINVLKQHIQQGDIYEINFCMEFFAEDVSIDPLQVYKTLNTISEAPFSALIKLNDTHIICSSPERFLKKENNTLYTQPIKGTAKRGSSEEEDVILKRNLKNSLKEQTENVMIVDVSRNDLSKVAEKGSVKADELFGIHTYKQVHQMVSTISCELKPETSFNDILQATFPMASMTGAPKERATELIQKYEATERGLYSGCIGYINEQGDFDLNVVIRTIIYNSSSKKISFHVGSAITAMCDAETEYEECLIKANAMLKALNATIG